MTAPQTPILERFVSIHNRMHANGELGQVVLRYATALLCDVEGEVERLVVKLQQNAHVLCTQASRIGMLKHPIRYVLTASLMSTEVSVADFCRALDVGQDQFRKAGLRRGGIYETIALLILLETAAQSVDGAMVERFKALYKMMKKSHWWLTGPDDYPFCALLTTSAGAVDAVGERVEAFYQALHAQGRGRGDQLQLTSHVLHFHPGTVADVVSRFGALVDAFSHQEQVWMDSYDEVALLCFLDAPGETIVATLVDHVEQLTALDPTPSTATLFSLATGTTLRTLASDFGDLRDLAHAHALVNAAQDAM